MEYAKLGSGGSPVSVLGFGCWAIGGHGYGGVDDQTSIAAVRRALDLGVNFFDTADVYGFGRSERVLAEALGARRHDVTIATKFGVCWDDTGSTWRDSSPRRAVAALDASLTRLRLERISLYQVHWPDGRTPLRETLEELERQRAAGKIDLIGVSNYSAAEIREASSAAVVSAAQYPFSLLERRHEPDIVECSREPAVSVIAYSVLGRGLLSGKFGSSPEFGSGDTRASDPNFDSAGIARSAPIIRKVREIAERIGATPSQVAIRWVLTRHGITTAIVGAKKPSQVTDNAGGVDLALTDADLRNLDALVG